MCHTTQTTDPNTGNTLDMPVMTHAIHIGSSFPTIESATPYQIVGFGNAVSSWSKVVYPPDVRKCKTCHNPSNGAAQTNAWLTTPNRAACGACHSNVQLRDGPEPRQHAGTGRQAVRRVPYSAGRTGV